MNDVADIQQERQRLKVVKRKRDGLWEVQTYYESHWIATFGNQKDAEQYKAMAEEKGAHC